jgi:hypothetical protein
MRLTAMMAMTVAAGMTVQAGTTNKNQVTVYVQNSAGVPFAVGNQAEVLASSMFASIGVKIDWRRGQAPASGRSLAIQLTANTPSSEHPRALAYAEPYEGVHIVVFWDRVEHGIAPPHLLAHVMVHEITHIIEGVCRHSESGIMKARWTDEDNKAMMIRPLTFTEEDVILIQNGLKARASVEHPPVVIAAK